ncbi:MAG TPA: alkaline phosphatase family protein [Vicinamibacteria bacterium]|nr:alkaline phosphatase family protein [Vicinamibacteria bacterium]
MRFSLALAGILAAAAVSGETERPKLVLFLSIDQGRAEYLARFRPVLEGGLLFLLERGVVFTETHHAHANTITAPGHASLSTGRFPSHTGIVGNDWYDRSEGREVYCIEDSDAPVLVPSGTRPASLGRSPRRLVGTTLGDWLKEHERASKVFSIAGKDRSAVLMAGKKADAAYWFDGKTGQWLSSRYYMEEYPAWVWEFQERRLADGYFGRTWEALPIPEALLASMQIEPAGAGARDGGIPRVIGHGVLAEDAGFYHALFETPFLESYLLAFAESLVREEGLGMDEATDVLAIGFSSVDSVGHDYGPNSREVLDAIVRLDRELGSFLRFLDRTIGLDKVAISLSADHGVAPLPEYQSRHDLPGGRIARTTLACVARAGRPEWFAAPLYFDTKALAKEKIEREEAEKIVSAEIAACPGVARVFTRSAIESAKQEDDSTLVRFTRAYYPDRSPDFFVQFEEGLIDDPAGTTHGSPYRYDTHVPGIIVFPGVAPASVGTPIETVDLPVTLALLLGLDPPKDVDGVDRSALMR